jgi:hypothetical protein
MTGWTTLRGARPSLAAGFGTLRALHRGNTYSVRHHPDDLWRRIHSRRIRGNTWLTIKPTPKRPGAGSGKSGRSHARRHVRTFRGARTKVFEPHLQGTGSESRGRDRSRARVSCNGSEGEPVVRIGVR